MKTSPFFIAFLCLAILFCSCSSDDDNDPTPDPIVQDPDPDPEPEPEPEPEVLSGVFLDSAVEGLTFETATQSGTTDSNGTFSYLEGESVTFSLSGIVIGSAPGQDEITPITLAQQIDATATVSSPLAANIAAFLQTLDADSDQSNGISITEGVAANLGVSNLDFSQSIESVLADIVLNVAQNEGSFLTVVPAYSASQNMAASLGVEFDGQENLTFSHFMPWLKTYFASTFNQNVPASAVYKNILSEDGLLTSTEITLRYSGRTIFALTFDGFNEAGLPNKGILSFERAGLPFGTFPPSNETLNDWEISYDGQNRVMTLQETQNGFSFEPLNFSGYDEQNRPLVFNQIFESEDGSSRNSLEYTLGFENGYLATETSTFEDSFTGDDFSFSNSSTNMYIYSYNGDKSFDEVTLNFESEFNDIFDGEEFNGSSQGTTSFTFDYSDAKLLQTIDRDTEGIDGEGNIFITSGTRSYDMDEILISSTFENDFGFEQDIQFTNGIARSIINTIDGLTTREEELFMDGSSNISDFFYDENDVLIEINISERDANFVVRKRIFELYVDGVLDFTFIDEFDANGVITMTTGLNADGSLSFIDTFNELGQLINTEFYFDGTISSIQEFEYDSNGFINRVVFKNAEGITVQIDILTLDTNGNVLAVEKLDGAGNLLFTEEWAYDGEGFLSQITVFDANGLLEQIFFYEQGALIRIETYDDDGNLIDIQDFGDSSGSSISKFSKKGLELDLVLRLDNMAKGVQQRNSPVKKSKELLDRKKSNNPLEVNKRLMRQHSKNTVTKKYRKVIFRY